MKLFKNKSFFPKDQIKLKIVRRIYRTKNPHLLVLKAIIKLVKTGNNEPQINN